MHSIREHLRLLESLSTAAPVLREGAAPFQLPSGAPPEWFQITSSLADVDNWKVRTLVANSGGKKGEMVEPGRVFVSLTSNTIIPISPADDHNNGYDLLNAVYWRKYNLDPRDFVGIPCGEMGNFFVYSVREVEPSQIAIRKWLEWGGSDSIVRSGAYDYHDPTRGLYTTMSAFVKMKPNQIKPQPGKLAHIGQQIVSGFDKLATACQKAHTDVRGTAIKAAGREAIKLINYIGSLAKWTLDLRDFDSQAFIAAVQKAVLSNNIQALEDAMFSFHGVKNVVHMRLRKALEATKTDRFLMPDDQKIKDAFGDLELAIDLLGRY